MTYNIVESLIGWFKIALVISLFVPNGSSFYQHMSQEHMVEYFIMTLLSVGLSTIYYSYTTNYKYRLGLMAVSACIWTLIGITYFDMIGVGPLVLFSAIIVVHSSVCMRRLYKLINY